MPGAISANFHEGTRSEYLALYAFSALGTAVPVPHPEDSGIDLHCTLGQRVGQKFIVEDYFLVQVKSTASPILYEGKEQVRWLLSHSYPFVICHIDKVENDISIYQTLGLSFLHSKKGIESIELVLDDEQAEFRIPQECSICTMYLGAPILQFNISELNKSKWREGARATLKAWVGLDQENIEGRKTGFTMYRHPNHYKINSPKISALSFTGNFKDHECNLDVKSNYYDLLFKQLAQLVNSSAAAGNKTQVLDVYRLARSVMASEEIPDCFGARIFAFCYNEAVKHLRLGDRYLISGVHTVRKRV
jgi:hypothetical protein